MMWLVLACSSVFELAFTVSMKLCDGFRNKLFSVLTVVSTIASIGLLSIATRTLPLGPAYAVWTGLGTVMNVVFGIVVFKEDRSFKKLFFLSLVLMGVIGLRLFG